MTVKREEINMHRNLEKCRFGTTYQNREKSFLWDPTVFCTIRKKEKLDQSLENKSFTLDGL